MSNQCPVCLGLGRIVAFGAAMQVVSLPCPECAGLDITPASAEDHQAEPVDDGPSIRQRSEPPEPVPSEPIEVVDQMP